MAFKTRKKKYYTQFYLIFTKIKQYSEVRAYSAVGTLNIKFILWAKKCPKEYVVTDIQDREIQGSVLHYLNSRITKRVKNKINALLTLIYIYMVASLPNFHRLCV